MYYLFLFTSFKKVDVHETYLLWGTYKVRNEIETKRNQRKRNETKSTKTKRNEINETNESKTKSTKTKRNRLI